ncbi:asparaginase [Streptomyces sp. AK02-01A]|uniref:asparaginase n=1 Tax=Streptomyces sp. AK02-01A TaxID=3028648 RepID=UPI0029BBC16B|nr:asparaginase [Streptomyces sp. AK02-01A]MDX3849206.1 asparaginase [Streptomyces sp. AK02-01A]
MPESLVAIASLGGTITMTAADGPRGLTPSLTARDLTASVPELAHVADIRAETLFSKPGASLGFGDLLQALDWSRRAVADGADGVVLVQGTDTLEETGYFLDLHWDRPEPLVVTGAMRPPRQPGADGPANLLAAVLTATAARSRGLGVLTVLNDEVHAAARVRKYDTTALDAFASRPFGPLARIHERSVRYAALPLRQPPVPPPRDGGHPRVALLETFFGDDGELLRLALGAHFDGIVISAFGAGHVSAAMASVVSEAVEKAPVVLASRTGSGSVLSDTYGFTGSEQDLLRRGAVSAGWLDARKARLLLWSLLAAGEPEDRIRAEFAARADGTSPTAR